MSVKADSACLSCLGSPFGNEAERSKGRLENSGGPCAK